jgi:hypothetical protein
MEVSMSRLLTNVVAKFKNLSKARPAPRPRQTRLGVEALEARLVMSANSGWMFSGTDPTPPPSNPWSYTVPSGHGSDTVQISVSGSYLQVLDNNVPVPGTPLYLPGITSISIQGGTSTVNKFLVQGVPAGSPMGIFFATASDSAVIGNAGSVQGIQSNLAVNGYSGSGKVTVDDSADPTTRTASLYSNSLGGLAPMMMSFNGVPWVVVKGGTSAGTTVTMYTPSTGNNSLTAAPGKSTLSGTGYFLEADTFAHVRAVNMSSSGSASLSSASGGTMSIYVGEANYSTLTEYSYSLEADYFSSVTAYSNSTGDVASLWGMSGGTNTFHGQLGDANLWSTYQGKSYYEDAHGFYAVKAYAGSAGDVAYLAAPQSYKSSFVGLSTSSFLGGYGWGIQANNFSLVYVSGNGSSSYAIMVSIGGDSSSYNGTPASGITTASGSLSGPGWSIQANGFTMVTHRSYYDLSTISDLDLLFYGIEAEQGWGTNYTLSINVGPYGVHVINW